MPLCADFGAGLVGAHYATAKGLHFGGPGHGVIKSNQFREVPAGQLFETSGRPNQPKGLREGRIAALLPRTLASVVNGAALLPSPSDLGPYSHANAGKSRSASERVSQACPCVHPFRNTPTGATPKGGSAEGPE
jgi:hypothetical protein